MTRSLVLAGGGMRVAWQTGVVQALQEHGLQFSHVDGTSGGILTAAMLLSGQTPSEMAARWSDLDVHAFSSPLPVRQYLRGPWALPALADADGVLGTVFPHLGIDVEAVRASAVPGTFNVCDFATKTCVPVPSDEVDADLLAAGMSLALVVPPLRRDGHVWTDAVWVKDANVTEALRRGAEEVWLVWCIGNTAYYGDGPLEQYVHMIEMSANGALFAELDAARAAGRAFRLHVVRPRDPLPLDPELFLGRISTDTLVAMGYRDACDYLDTMSPLGVGQDSSCTRMHEAEPGVRVTERLHGTVDGAPLTAVLTLELPLAGAGAGRVVGHVDHAPWGGRVLLAGGTVQEEAGGRRRLRCTARVDGRVRRLELVQGAGARTSDLWVDGRLAGELHGGPGELVRAALSVEPVGVHGLLARTRLLALFAVRLLRALRHAPGARPAVGAGRDAR
ncbi:MAG: hypothetical protein JWO60_430 [Frankiales bacterium]|nr:hypothetical protein [Frankiales bacterium]